MSRWLKNVNALLENLDSQVEETVEEHRFHRTLASARRGGGDGDGGAGAAEELMREEARGVDDVLARRGLLGGDEDEGEGGEEGGEGGANDDGNVNDGSGDSNFDAVDEPPVAAGDATDDANPSADPRIVLPADLDEGGGRPGAEGEGIDVVSEETVNFDSDSVAHVGEPKKELFADAEVVPAAEGEESGAPASADQPSDDGGTTSQAPPPEKPKQAPSSSNPGGAPPSGNRTAPAAASAAHVKELRRLRRHVLQLNADLEAAERELDAQRRELDRAASRMERDRSRHKQERESLAVSHKAEVASLVAAHEGAMAQLRDAHEAKLVEVEERASRAERRRAEEGGERDAELAEALERERAGVADAARLREEKATADGRVSSLMTEVGRLGARLERAEERAELASERERNAEEQLDKALSLHARQLGVRQGREGELERTVADLGAALVVAKGKIEKALRAGIDLDGDNFGRSKSDGVGTEEESLDLKARLQDSQDEVETLCAQLNLERQRCSTLHIELQDLSREQADELSGAHAKQRQHERKISDLTMLVAKLQSSLQRTGVDDDGEGLLRSGGKMGLWNQPSGDEKKETDHLRKQIASLSEKIFGMQSKIDSGRGEVSTLKNRLRSAQLRTETAEKELEAANQRLIMMDSVPSGVSSADEETGGRRMPRPARRRRPVESSAARRQRGVNKPSKVDSIRSSLGLHPGRFPSGSWKELLGGTIDVFDALAVDLGSHFRHHPLSRLAFLLYLLVLHAWAFFLLVYHAHAQGVTGHAVGPEALLKNFRHMKQVPGGDVAAAPGFVAEVAGQAQEDSLAAGAVAKSP